ncbi:MAG: hypothetical protein IPK88_19685 [Saprospiraceae bacterium]|uniref:Uncharacterized protein n=1 Tax=Candidatus Defluviibacterium haderslevense TaxID=2981993 RepID=A0A9D7XDM5_9BACT|nr:hypothetical protein [Candidatus Defluviibacterium haderslevense]MBK9718119.1 hypothetical protein [Candidatus Defluviibacterium haderslevense]MBL0237101.1 hypothetical protein [Candidatus Defluviibacterium haderslevense]
MISEGELNAEILRVTLKIHTEYPELSKFIEEMPVTIPNVDRPEINISILSDYLDSLNSLIFHYKEGIIQ